MNEIKDNTNKWKGIPCSTIGRPNILKMAILPKTIYRFNAILTQLPMVFFTELEWKLSQLVWKHKRPWLFKASWERRMELEESTFLTSDFTKKLQSSNTVLAQKQKYRPMEQTRKLRVKLTQLWAPYIWQNKKEYTVEKDSLFNNWCWEN